VRTLGAIINRTAILKKMTYRFVSILCILFLLQSSCSEKTSCEKCNYYSLGAFYANNNLNAKDSSNHFQQNCHFQFLLNSDTLEVYNRNSYFPNKEEITTKLFLNAKDKQHFIDIVKKLTKNKSIYKDHDFIYDGLSYIVSMNTCDKSDFGIANLGMEKEDEDFINELFEESKTQKRTEPTNLIIKERYFMKALIHQENYFEIKNVEFKQ
jgi:hypothetical protein